MIRYYFIISIIIIIIIILLLWLLHKYCLLNCEVSDKLIQFQFY